MLAKIADMLVGGVVPPLDLDKYGMRVQIEDCLLNKVLIWMRAFITRALNDIAGCQNQMYDQVIISLIRVDLSNLTGQGSTKR